MNDQPQPPESNDAQKAQIQQPAGLKAAAIDLFKKSQRLPLLSLIQKKKGEKKSEKKGGTPVGPPHGFEFADFYHL